MEYLVSQPPLVIVPGDNTTFDGNPPCILNANQEPVVDFMLGTLDEATLIAFLNPGLTPGQRLLLRYVRRGTAGVTDNQAGIQIYLMQSDGSNDWGGTPGFVVYSMIPQFQSCIEFGPFGLSSPYGPGERAFASLEWTGTQWNVLTILS